MTRIYSPWWSLPKRRGIRHFMDTAVRCNLGKAQILICFKSISFHKHDKVGLKQKARKGINSGEIKATPGSLGFVFLERSGERPNSNNVYLLIQPSRTYFFARFHNGSASCWLDKIRRNVKQLKNFKCNMRFKSERKGNPNKILKKQNSYDPFVGVSLLALCVTTCWATCAVFNKFVHSPSMLELITP